MKVKQALQAAMQARSKRTEVTSDRVVAEYARVAFANVRDFLPKEGEPIDLSRLDLDRAAAVEEFSVHEVVDAAGVIRRHTWLKLHDKLAALTNLARHLGMFTDRRVAESSIEAQIMRMTPQERVLDARRLAEEGRQHSQFLETAKARMKPGRPRPS